MRDALDRSILVRFVQGDQSAFEAVYRHCEADVYRWIARIVRDEAAAEDVLVEAFWRAYRGRARFDPSRSFAAWMRRIATHAALDHLRSKRKHAGPALTDAPLPASEDPDRALPDSIAAAFGRLPPKLRVAATLALVEGQPYAEIADALEVPVGTVKSRVFRAVRALRKELARLGTRT
jgi:RNA polymerase sigma-70 factor (ECF subfamily)